MITVALLIASALPASSVDAPTPVPKAIEAQGGAADPLLLRAGTPIPMQTAIALSSLTNRQGDRFDLTVTEDVVVGGYTVIRRGSRGIGEITSLVPKGSFGKSGKLEVALLYVEAGADRIRLDGRAASRGHSGTAGTVVTAVLVGTFAAFVTGSSATIATGSPMTGFIARDLPIVLRRAGPSK